MENNQKYTVMLCSGTGCVAGGNLKIREEFHKEIVSKGLSDRVEIKTSTCNGFCPQGPVVVIHPDSVLYQKVTIKDVPTIVEEHLMKGGIVERLTYKEPTKKQSVASMKDIPFFNRQVLRVMRNKAMLDPDSIDDYIQRDGYKGAKKALLEMKPEDVINVIKLSGLRGRGGGGMPTGSKWEVCANQRSDQKFILCNRSIIEVEPHLIIEGMIIGAWAVGASHGYIYVRAGSPMLIERMQRAISQATQYGLLGSSILGSGFSLTLEIFKSADEFVSGEETSALMSIEGKRGMPTPKPPYPAERGLWDKPTLIDTVETFANIPAIILNGAEWFRSVGTESSPGTKVFALSGPLQTTGIIEVPFGTTLRTIINDIGGGIIRGRQFKAVQVGGSTGGYIPEKHLDTPITYENIQDLSAIIGSGGIAVMSDLNCMVSSARFTMEFACDESCGKCPPCRIGTSVMLDILDRITKGEASVSDIDILEDLAFDVKEASLCGLGKTAVLPVISGIRFFREEYEEHIKGHFCRAGVCKDLVTFYIDKEKCIGCGACSRVCPKKAISGEKKKPHIIDQTLCIQCRACYETCKFDALKVGPRSMREELKMQDSQEGLTTDDTVNPKEKETQ
ncbi:MAG: NADH-ubiquinone oxidoreductase-F iron-sulfur binding region domain-containing protein [Thermodesulfovibrionales bacterium]